MPTFQSYQNGVRLDEVKGARPEALEVGLDLRRLSDTLM
jgi:hypothetical protein